MTKADLSPARSGGWLADPGRRHHVAQVIAGVCRTEVQVPALDPAARAEFIQAVRHHRIAPLAQVRLRTLDAAAAEALRADRDQAKVTYLRSAILLQGLGFILDEIPWVAFKGPILSEHAHPVPGLRSYNDVDVLVAPATLREVCKRLFEAGWRLFDRQDMLQLTDTPGEMHWISPAGVPLDLHWSMINMAGERRQFPDVTDGLLANRVTVPVGLSSAWTLSPVDTFVHVCLHASLTGAHKLLWLLDADQLARRVEDWDLVIATAHRWGAGPALALVLARARSFLGTPLPSDLDRQLGTSRMYRAVTRTVDRVSPVPALRREASLARLLARSARPGAWQSLATAGRRAIRGFINRVRPQKLTLPWDERPPADASALKTYLDAVENAASHSKQL